MVRILYLPAKSVALTSPSPSLAGMKIYTPRSREINWFTHSWLKAQSCSPQDTHLFRFLLLPLMPSNGISIPHTLPTMLSYLPPFLLLHWTPLTLKVLPFLPSTLSCSLISLTSSFLEPLHFLSLHFLKYWIFTKSLLIYPFIIVLF